METSLSSQLNSGAIHFSFMKNTPLLDVYFYYFGGEDGIRTHAGLASPSSFRNCPLQPLGYFSSGGIIAQVTLRNVDYF